MLKKEKTGFTMFELIIVVVFAAILVVLFFIQKSNIDAMNRDDQRKTAINAMHYALEESFYPTHGHYPETISDENLKAMDPALFTDPFGINVGIEGSSYRYEPIGCEEEKCRSYTLRAILEREDVYIRQSRN
jgi:Tfp pilus assembly protein PilE